jgi:hypothetical protein
MLRATASSQMTILKISVRLRPDLADERRRSGRHGVRLRFVLSHVSEARHGPPIFVRVDAKDHWSAS